jgi:hypothetical protein
MTRRVVLLFTSMMAFVVLGGAGTSADAHQDVGWPCGDVLDGKLGHRGVQKTVAVSDGSTGGALLDVNLTTTRRISETLVVECTWIDLDADSTRDVNEAVEFHLEPVQFHGNHDRSGSFQLELPDAAGRRVCDMVVVLALQPPHVLVPLRSNVACGQARAPAVAEAGAVPLLGLSALAVVVTAVVVVRRRRPAVAVSDS